MEVARIYLNTTSSETYANFITNVFDIEINYIDSASFEFKIGLIVFKVQEKQEIFYKNEPILQIELSADISREDFINRVKFFYYAHKNLFDSSTIEFFENQITDQKINLLDPDHRHWELIFRN
jgi:hypothetical protein